jgi:VWA domain-containing protein
MRSALLLLLVLANCPAHAQDCTQTLPINVLDQKTGNAVTALKPESLQARMGESAARITGIAPAKKRRILVLADESGSMVGNPQKIAVQAVEETIGELLAYLPDGTSVAYGFFSDISVFTPEFFSDPERLRQAIAEARTQMPTTGKGGTPLFDALHQAMLRFGTIRPGDTIVVLTDAGENTSKLRPSKVGKEIRGSGLRLVLLLAKLPVPIPEEVRPDGDTLIGIAQDTGGAIGAIDIIDRSWNNRKDAEVNRQALRKFWIQEVLGGFLMQVQVPASLQKPKKWSVRIDPAAYPELKHAIVQYPAKLAPCQLNTAAVH